MVQSAAAYETDQFTQRLQPIADSTRTLDWWVNYTLLTIAEEWQGPRDDQKFVDEIYHRIGGHHWVDRIERWAMESAEVDRVDMSPRESVYQGHPIWATRVAALFGVGPTIRLNEQMIGSDKLGHFLSQGRKYYRRYLKSLDEAQAAEWSAYTERAIFGQLTTGSYSNADLVANYEGYRFYRSLFDDETISGKPAILRWEAGAWTVQRPFSWADHVNEYWDEALNVNHFDGWLYDHMRARLLEFCPEYFKAPELWSIENEAALRERYAHLQLRDTRELRLDALCTSKDGPTIQTAAQTH